MLQFLSRFACDARKAKKLDKSKIYTLESAATIKNEKAIDMKDYGRGSMN